MSGFGNAPTRARTQTLEAVRNASGSFDVDAWHVMDERDNALIAQEIIHGSGSSKFVYSFKVSGTEVTGISVIGARHLASHYGGIKHRLLASVTKIGALFTFTSYPADGVPMNVDVKLIDALKAEDDYYEVLVEVTDIKTGNTLQVRKRESALESRRDGSKFARPHYSVIAEAKAYRNAVLAIIDQAVQLEWKHKMLALGKDDVITDSVLEEKRSQVLRFAASKSVPIDRRLVEALTLDQISGLGDATRAGGEAEFRRAAESLRVMMPNGIVEQNPPRLAAEQAARAMQAAAQPAAQAPAATAPDVRPEAETHAAAPAQPHAPREPDPGPYEAYLVDEFGELAEGNSHFRDPAVYLRALSYMALTSRNVPALMENNADEIDAARRANPKAGEAFDADVAALVGAPAAQQAKAPAPLTVPTKGGKPDLGGYLALVADHLAAINTADDLAAWSNLNAGVIGTLPSVTRKASQKAIADRGDALGASRQHVAAQPASAPPAQPDDAPQPAEDLGEHGPAFLRLMQRVNACGNADHLTALGNETEFNAEMALLPVTLKTRLRNHASALRAEFNQRGA